MPENTYVDALPIFNRGELERAIGYWYARLENVKNNNEERSIWCAINAIRYCIDNCSKYQS